MKKFKGRRKKWGSISSAALAVAIIATALVFFLASGKMNPFVEKVSAAVSKYSSSAVAIQNAAAETEKSRRPASKNDLTVNYINVGQGDSILITKSGHAMLIDAGTEQSAKTVVNYIKSKKITTLDYCIGTHPHEDHIGGMDNVIYSFKVSTFIMPNVTTNTKSFSDVLRAAQKRKLHLTRPAPGKSYKFCGATFTILAPNSAKYKDLNDYSVVVRLVYGSKSFLFTGDAQSDSENEMLKKHFTLKSDVLKVGHHGSKTSTTAAFLKAVAPKYAVISVGKKNDYGLPSQPIISRLSAAGIKIYRTDQYGTVVVTTDGKSLCIGH